MSTGCGDYCNPKQYYRRLLKITKKKLPDMKKSNYNPDCVAHLANEFHSIIAEYELKFKSKRSVEWMVQLNEVLFSMIDIASLDDIRSMYGTDNMGLYCNIADLLDLEYFCNPEQYQRRVLKITALTMLCKNHGVPHPLLVDSIIKKHEIKFKSKLSIKWMVKLNKDLLVTFDHGGHQRLGEKNTIMYGNILDLLDLGIPGRRSNSMELRDVVFPGRRSNSM
jgi:hypothetical protein